MNALNHDEASTLQAGELELANATREGVMLALVAVRELLDNTRLKSAYVDEQGIRLEMEVSEYRGGDDYIRHTYTGTLDVETILAGDAEAWHTGVASAARAARAAEARALRASEEAARIARANNADMAAYLRVRAAIEASSSGVDQNASLPSSGPGGV